MQYEISKGITLMLAAACLVWGGLATAEVYRWVDEDGEVHYSDRPVQGSESVDVDVPPPGESDSNAAPDEYPAGADPDAEKAKVRAAQCELAKTRLKSYEEAETLLRRNEDTGEEAELSADERVDLIVQTQRRVREWCGDDALAEDGARVGLDGSPP